MKKELLAGLSEEQIAKARACKNSDELLALAKEEGVELTDEQLEVVTGGRCTSSTKCPNCGCRSFDWGESNNCRKYYCCKCHTFVYEVHF